MAGSPEALARFGLAQPERNMLGVGPRVGPSSRTGSGVQAFTASLV